LDKTVGRQTPAAAWTQKNQPVGPPALAELKLGPPIRQKPLDAIIKVAPKTAVPKQCLGVPQ
jgi:hypothetical protein